MNTSRTCNGHPVAYRRTVQRHWTGGRGYVFTPEYIVWNPAHPEKTLTLCEAWFFALTEEVQVAALAA